MPVSDVLDMDLANPNDLKNGKNQFSGKAVIIGIDILTGQGLLDVKVTPFGKLPGMYVHATLLDNLLRKNYIKRFSTSGELFALFLICIMNGLLLFYFRHFLKLCICFCKILRALNISLLSMS